MTSDAAAVAGVTLAPVTFGASLVLTIGNSVTGYVSNTAKGMARSIADTHAKTLCEIAQTIFDGEIEAEKLWINSLIVEIKGVAGAAYLAVNLTKQVISIRHAIRIGEVSNASKILLNSSRLLQALIVGYIACCVVSDTLEDIASQWQNTIHEIENQLNEKDSDDEHIELNRILLLQLLGFDVSENCHVIVSMILSLSPFPNRLATVLYFFSFFFPFAYYYFFLFS